MVLHLERYAFLMEWEDKSSHSIWSYQLLYYPQNKELEMHDVKNRRVFLKKSTLKHLVLEMMHPGSRVNILSRQLKVVDYGDDSTRKALKALHEQTCLVGKLTDLQLLGAIIQKTTARGLFISDVKLRRLTSQDVSPLLATIASSSWENGIIVVELIGKDATKTAAAITHEMELPQDLYAPKSPTDASCLVTSLRQQPLFAKSWIEGSTIAVLKPHTLRDGTAGAIINKLSADFSFHNVRSVVLDPSAASQFCDVYKDALSLEEFSEMVEELSSGLLLAINVSSKDLGIENSVESLREICGPMDPDLGRFVRPSTLRSHFGLTKTQNAVHCTDLDEDGALEYCILFNS